MILNKIKQLKRIVYHKRVPMIVYKATELGHIGIFAQTGSGKGVFGQALAGIHYNAGFKVIDWDVSRQENTLYPFPNKDKSMVDRIYKCNRKPQGFPCEVLFPLTSKEGLIGGKYPENWRPFKIDFAELTSAEIVLMLEDATPQSVNIINSILFNNHLKPREEAINSLNELIDLLFDLHMKLKHLAKTTTNTETGRTHTKPVSVHPSTLSSLERETMGLFEKGLISDSTEKILLEICSKADSNTPQAVQQAVTSLKKIEKQSLIGRKTENLCLDINDIMNDQKTITSINLFSCKSFREKALCFSWFWRRTMELRKTKSKKPTGTYPQILFRCAEAHSFAPSKGIAMAGSDHSLKIMQEIATEGRDAQIKLLLDTQGSTQLNNKVHSQLSVFYLGRMDLTNINHFHEKINTIPQHWVMKDNIQKQEIGTFTKIWNNSREYCYPLFVCPSLNRSKEAGQNIKDIYRFKKNYLGKKFGWYTLNYNPKIKVGFKTITAKEKLEIDDEVEEITKKQPRKSMYNTVISYVKDKFLVERIEKIELQTIAFELDMSVGSVHNVLKQQPGVGELDFMKIELVKVGQQMQLRKRKTGEVSFRKIQEETKKRNIQILKLKEKKLRKTLN